MVCKRRRLKLHNFREVKLTTSKHHSSLFKDNLRISLPVSLSLTLQRTRTFFDCALQVLQVAIHTERKAYSSTKFLKYWVFKHFCKLKKPSLLGKAGSDRQNRNQESNIYGDVGNAQVQHIDPANFTALCRSVSNCSGGKKAKILDVFTLATRSLNFPGHKREHSTQTPTSMGPGSTSAII